MEVTRCICTLRGIAPIAFSKPVAAPKKTGERHDDYEERTWRERMHVDAEGHAFIPPMALKNCLSEVAKYDSLVKTHPPSRSLACILHGVWACTGRDATACQGRLHVSTN